MTEFRRQTLDNLIESINSPLLFKVNNGTIFWSKCELAKTSGCIFLGIVSSQVEPSGLYIHIVLQTLDPTHPFQLLEYQMVRVVGQI